MDLNRTGCTFLKKATGSILLGNDLRGTIYAIYTFAEEVLGVPPLKYWCSWKAEMHEEISIAADLDIYYPSPQGALQKYPSGRPGFLYSLEKTLGRA
jgi:hypothetical protein